DSEEARPGEVDDAGVTELHVQAQARDDDDQHPREQQQREVVLAQDERKRDHGGENETSGEALVAADRSRKRLQNPGPDGHRAGGNTEKDERRDGGLRFRPEQEPDVGGGHHREEDCESSRSHTRSLARSPIRPVGRMAINKITTPKANTSLYALANGSATAPMVCSAAKRKPPTIAPYMFPRPPRIAAANPMTPRSNPIPKNTSL